MRGVLLGCLLLSTPLACADWGRNATYTPGWQRTAWAAHEALLHPMTWLPAFAGVAIHISGHDAQWTEELHSDAPLFGNTRRANQRSDDFRHATDVLWGLSIVFVDTGEDARLRHTVHGVLVQTAAIGTTRLTSNALKRAIHRDEPGATPGEADGDAFPSNHATGPFAQAALVRENMQQTRLARPLATLYTGAAYVAASGAAWGRIEAGGHYVSDQLLGAALGNFVATFINNAFMGGGDHLRIGTGNGRGVLAHWTLRF
ncbi:MAG: phosphatase PAP2 family protein [Gammaproteobacteria bacterium]|nr:phosphatase PAP2 family protein [Gammaproteobacteria bacterium]